MPMDVLKNKRFFWLLLLIPFAIYLLFGTHHLSKFETADEHFWLYNSIEGRIHSYWRAIENKDLVGTRINDKPGITLAYISGIGLLFEKNPSELIKEKKPSFRVHNPEKFKRVNLTFRLPLLIFNGIFVFYFFWIIRKLTESDWLALFCATLIWLNPILIGISQIVNPDSLLWSFSFASLLSFLTFLKNDQNKYAILASVFLGLALLSKYAATILILYFALIIIIHFIFHFHEWSPKELSEKVKKIIFSYLLIIFGAVLLFSFLMPAVFVDKNILLRSTIGFREKSPIWIFGLFFFILGLILADAHFRKSKTILGILRLLLKLKSAIPKIVSLILFAMFSLVLANWGLGDNFLDIKGVAFDAGKTYQFRRHDLYDQIFLEMYPLVFSLTPLVIFSLLYIWLKSFLKKTTYEELIFILSLFVVIFYVAVLQQQLLVNIRYTVILYPLLMLLVGIAMVDFLSLEKLKKVSKTVVFFAIIIFSLVSLFLIKPYYFNYTNDLLPKDKIITGAWGYGGYEAAEYLNSLPDAENLLVWSDYRGFCPFFKGKCLRMVEISEKKLGFSAREIDYYILTRRGALASKNALKKAGAEIEEEPVKTIIIDGRPKNFINVYKAIK